MNTSIAASPPARRVCGAASRAAVPSSATPEASVEPLAAGQLAGHERVDRFGRREMHHAHQAERRGHAEREFAGIGCVGPAQGKGHAFIVGCVGRNR